MKIYIISYVPAQIPCLGKFLFLRYGPKCSQQIRLQYFLISDFLHVDSNSHKLKYDENIHGLSWSEMSVASLVTGF